MFRSLIIHSLVIMSLSCLQFLAEFFLQTDNFLFCHTHWVISNLIHKWESPINSFILNRSLKVFTEMLVLTHWLKHCWIKYRYKLCVTTINHAHYILHNSDKEKKLIQCHLRWNFVSDHLYVSTKSNMWQSVFWPRAMLQLQ